MNLVMKKILSLVLVIMCVIPFGWAATAETNKETALTWPVPGHYSVTQEYIDTPERFHNGIDILDNNIAGATVSAAMGGTVKKVFKCTYHHDTSDVSCYGYGTCVIIYGDDGRSYIYAHLLGGSIPSEVYEGAKVAKGAKIGQVGNTGYSYAYHLHFVVADGEDYLHNTFDPLTLTFEEHPDNATALTAAGVKYPVHLESGAKFEIFGTVFSPYNIIFGEVKVTDADGRKLFAADVNKEYGKSIFDLSEYASMMDFSSLSDGTYQYSLDVLDERGYSVRIEKPFTVGSSESTLDAVDLIAGIHDCDNPLVDDAYRWDGGQVTKEPNCTSHGVKTYTCRECGNTRLQVIAVLPHDFEEEFTVDSEPNFKGAVGYKSRHCRACDARTDITEIPTVESSETDFVEKFILVSAVPILICLAWCVIFFVRKKRWSK